MKRSCLANLFSEFTVLSFHGISITWMKENCVYVVELSRNISELSNQKVPQKHYLVRFNSVMFKTEAADWGILKKEVFWNWIPSYLKISAMENKFCKMRGLLARYITKKVFHRRYFFMQCDIKLQNTSSIRALPMENIWRDIQGLKNIKGILVRRKMIVNFVIFNNGFLIVMKEKQSSVKIYLIFLDFPRLILTHFYLVSSLLSTKNVRKPRLSVFY